LEVSQLRILVEGLSLAGSHGVQIQLEQLGKTLEQKTHIAQSGILIDLILKQKRVANLDVGPDD
jgi:hypothetical protein